MKFALKTLIATMVVAAMLPIASSSAAIRTWVSGVGDDINPCSRTAPCKTFAGAHANTDYGGEIDALDPGGFGAVTVTKSLTIDGGGGLAGIANSLTNGVTINAPDDDVVLRNISIIGGGTCPTAGLVGVRIISAHSVTLQNVTIEHQLRGVEVAPTAGAVNVLLDGVKIANNCTAGVNVVPVAPGSANVVIKNNSITNSVTGVNATGPSIVSLLNNVIFGNTTPVQGDGIAKLVDLGGNQQINNTNAGSLVPPTPPAPPAVVYCVVPKLSGLTEKAAKAKLVAAHCVAGKSSSKTTRSKKQNGKVIAQNVPSGIRAVENTSVKLTIGKYKKK